jgi:hypothetical protein
VQGGVYGGEGARTAVGGGAHNSLRSTHGCCRGTHGSLRGANGCIRGVHRK